MIKKLSIVSSILLTVACSPAPYTGTSVTQTTNESGVTLTRAETREILPSGGLAGSDSELRQLEVSVEKVNLKSRTIAIKTPDGKVSVLTVGPEVRNLAQVKAGDKVRVDYFQSVEFEVRKPTTTELAESDDTVALLGRAALGQRPAGLVAAGSTSVMTIAGIDKTNQTVTLNGSTGRITVKAKHPENLNYAKIGDTVVITVSELFAANVVPLK